MTTNNATPVAAEAPNTDAEDAARYRWLRDCSTSTWSCFQDQWMMPAKSCDAIIDMEMKKQREA